MTGTIPPAWAAGGWLDGAELGERECYWAKGASVKDRARILLSGMLMGGAADVGPQRAHFRAPRHRPESSVPPAGPVGFLGPPVIERRNGDAFP